MITQEQHDAAVAAARTEGHATGVLEGSTAGAKATTDRLTTILSSDKVTGKEVAALNLAITSPEMSADAVIAFVEKNVSATAAPLSIAARTAGQGALLALGHGADKPKGETKIDTKAIFAARAAQQTETRRPQ